MSKTENEAAPAENPAKPLERAPNQVEAVPLSPEQLEDLKTKAAKADENWDRLLRTTADFENFKKRAAREKIESAQYASFTMLQKLLPILDNFEMALAATQTATAGAGAKTPDDGKLASLRSGVTMIQQQLKNVLVESGMEEIDAAGQPFDPNFHEAISQQESAEVPEGRVLQQIRKGYKIKDRLLRPAAVIVARKPAAPNSPKDGPGANQ